MRINNIVTIQCNECGNQINLQENDFDHQEYSSARESDKQVEHNFVGDLICSNCEGYITLNIKAWEYPKGFKDLETNEISGGRFIVPPVTEVK